ncbi:MAG: EF-hand domain-containing protein [Betaproteobacteria bacterium]|nr:EF-hand domain-containing protein [Betaproteobacteria bacterium]
MMLKKAIIAVLLLAPVLSLAAQEGVTGGAAKRPRLAEQFRLADADGNGALSRAETEKGLARLASVFDAIDANRDAAITPEEIRAWLKARRGERQTRREALRAKFDEFFAKADSDGDGALSRAEAENNMPRVAGKFDRIDGDRDGRITREEIRAFLQAKRAARTGRS